MKLSKQETKYRNKLFSENNAVKQDQIEIDKSIKESKFFNTYKKLYQLHRTNNLNHMFPHTNMKRLIKYSNELGVTIKKSDGTFRRLSDVLDDLSVAWNKHCKSE